jgi:hypothetical protein
LIKTAQCALISRSVCINRLREEYRHCCKAHGGGSWRKVWARVLTKFLMASLMNVCQPTSLGQSTPVIVVQPRTGKRIHACTYARLISLVRSADTPASGIAMNGAAPSLQQRQQAPTGTHAGWPTSRKKSLIGQIIVGRVSASWLCTISAAVEICTTGHAAAIRAEHADLTQLLLPLHPPPPALWRWSHFQRPCRMAQDQGPATRQGPPHTLRAFPPHLP